MERLLALCYNTGMRTLRYVCVISISVLLSGCALTGKQTDTLPSGSPQISYAQVKSTPESYGGQSVTFGGKVLAARRLKEGTRIEILQLPLAASLQPTTDLSKSEGRFVAMQKEFLDPATVPPGTFVTITGEMAGSVTLPLDEMQYSYPVVRINNLRVWNDNENEAPHLRPYPYMGHRPYWSPYWSPWPYYW